MRAFAALALVPALAACADDQGAEVAPLEDFAVTSPDGFAELVPGGAVELAWTVTARPQLSLEIDLVAGVAPPWVITHDRVQPGSFTWGGLDSRNQPLPPDNYRVRAAAIAPDDGTVDTFDGDAAHLVVVQGVRFRDASLAFTGAQADRQIVLSTVTRSPMELTLALDPDPGRAGDELPLLTASIPGELVPFARSYPFTGRTAADGAVPAGFYVVAALISTRDGAVQYRIDGPGLTWTP